MDDLLTIALEAHNEELNHHRRYEIVVGRDLLDHWTVSVRYGRVGCSFRELKFGSPDAHETKRLIHDRLRKRLSAPRRIGCSYRLRELSIETPLADWLPSVVITRLLSG